MNQNPESPKALVGAVGYDNERYTDLLYAVSDVIVLTKHCTYYALY